MEGRFERFEGDACASDPGEGPRDIADEIAAAIGAPDRVLIEAGDLPGRLRLVGNFGLVAVEAAGCGGEIRSSLFDGG